jgi:hypothetical protein
MPRNGSYTLGEVRAEWVVISCEVCGRKQSWRTAALLHEHGPDISMPDLKFALITCPNIDTSNLNPCRAVYSRETRMSWKR